MSEIENIFKKMKELKTTPSLYPIHPQYFFKLEQPREGPIATRPGKKYMYKLGSNL